MTSLLVFIHLKNTHKVLYVVSRLSFIEYRLFIDLCIKPSPTVFMKKLFQDSRFSVLTQQHTYVRYR